MSTSDTSVRSRRFRAILAGGLVLGVGAAITLAAWNDSEFATGTFAAGQFNLEGSTDGTTFADHADSGAAATLDFTLAPDDMSPDDVVYAAFAVRLDDTTTGDATVTLTSGGTTGVVTGLTYGLVTTATFGCDAAAFTAGTSLVPAATALDTASGTFPLVAGAGAAGTPVNLCYQVTADAALTQGQNGTATWQFAAVSD